MKRLVNPRFLVLVFALLSLQWQVTAHAIDHTLQADDESCEFCLLADEADHSVALDYSRWLVLFLVSAVFLTPGFHLVSFNRLSTPPVRAPPESHR